MRLDPNSPARFEQIASDLSPGDAAECITGVLHLSSSTLTDHYHFWVTGSGVVPSAIDFFRRNGFDHVSFIPYADRDHYKHHHSCTAPLRRDDLDPSSCYHLHRNRVMDTKGGVFQIGVSLPSRKQMKKRNKAKARHSIHGPLFAGPVAVAVVEGREEVERAAILRLQCLARVVIAKRALHEKKWMNVSATRIQALWRSRMVQKINQWADDIIRLHDELRDIGTTTIQVCKVFVCTCLCVCMYYLFLCFVVLIVFNRVTGGAGLL